MTGSSKKESCVVIFELQNQIRLTADKRNTIIRINRAAKTALEVFDDILNKEKLDRNDLELMIEKIKVYEDHLDIQLKADIDSLLKCGTLPDEEATNFERGMEDISPIIIVQASEKRPDKVFHANVISKATHHR